MQNPALFASLLLLSGALGFASGYRGYELKESLKTFTIVAAAIGAGIGLVESGVWLTVVLAIVAIAALGIFVLNKMREKGMIESVELAAIVAALASLGTVVLVLAVAAVVVLSIFAVVSIANIAASIIRGLVYYTLPMIATFIATHILGEIVAAKR